MGRCQGPLAKIEMCPRTTAVVLIDLQYLYHRDFGAGARLRELGTFETRRYMYDRLDSLVVPNVCRLLDACRAVGIRVIYTRNCSLYPDGADGSANWRRQGKEQGVNWCALGSKESEILDEVRPLAHKIVLHKTSSGVFNSTSIDTLLANIGVTTLLFYGAATNHCVETSVRGASDRGYDAVLVSDGCAAVSDRHEHLAWEILDGIYCRVLSTDEILDRIGRTSTG